MSSDDYIKRGPLKEAIMKKLCIFGEKYLLQSERAIVDEIDKAPAEDVVPVVRGTWIDHSGDGYLECPFCGAATNCDGDESELHYCFRCGARLELLPNCGADCRGDNETA